MKNNYTILTLGIILLVALIGLILISQSQNITGQTYNYGSFFGPQGQKQIKVTNPLFMPAQKEEIRPYVAACCNIVRLADAGLTRCPQTLDLFARVCGLGEEYELEFFYPPCHGRNDIVCFIPFE